MAKNVKNSFAKNNGDDNIMHIHEEIHSKIKQEIGEIRNDMLKHLKEKKYKKVIEIITNRLKKFYQKKQKYDRFKITPYTNILMDKYNLDSYVNASEVVFKEITYFPCQLPKEIFRNEFLDFLKQIKCQLIISLVPLHEEDYFKDIKAVKIKKHFSKYNEIIFYEEDFIFNNISIKRLRFVRWEDFSVPNKEEFEMYYNKIEEEKVKCKKMVVHCQAGVGRTGVTIMYDMLKNIKNIDEEDFLDVFLYLRSSRPCLVYNEDQLKFLASIFLKNH